MLVSDTFFNFCLKCFASNVVKTDKKTTFLLCYSKVILALWHSAGTRNFVYRIVTNLASIDPMQQKVKVKPIDIMSLKQEIGSVRRSFSHCVLPCKYTRFNPLSCIWEVTGQNCNEYKSCFQKPPVAPISDKSSWDTWLRSPSPLINVGKYCVFFFFQQKGKNHPVINIVSGGREELARCPEVFVRDCRNHFILHHKSHNTSQHDFK